MHGNHMKHMLMAGGGLLVVLLVAGVPLGTELPYAIALACPLMMVAMIVMMGRGQAGQGRGGHAEAHAHHDDAVTATTPEVSHGIAPRGQ